MTEWCTVCRTSLPCACKSKSTERTLIKPARVLYVDPPWPEDQGMVAPRRPTLSTGNTGRADDNYNLLTLHQIESFPLPPTEPNCWLFLWTPQRRIKQAFDVMHAWRFKDTGSAAIWVKTDKLGRPINNGMGYYLRIAHEVLLIGKKGRPGPPLERNIPSVVMAPREGHSRKPEKFAQMIARFAAGPYTELFARKNRPGWQCLGNELPRGNGYYNPLR